MTAATKSAGATVPPDRVGALGISGSTFSRHRSMFERLDRALSAESVAIVRQTLVFQGFASGTGRAIGVSMTNLHLLAIIGLVATPLVGCTPEGPDAGDDDDAETSAAAVVASAGVNGSACYMSDYNCKLRGSGGNRINHTDGTPEWGVDENVAVLDGNGDVVGISKSETLKFNYGQHREFNGHEYVFAMTTSNKSAGWFPLASVKSGEVLKSRLGTVNAHRAGMSKMACYEIRNDSDSSLEEKKVVYDTASAPGPAGEAAGDYLPRVRANGKRSMNLVFNLPGSDLGGPAIDHFPAGTKFQRVDVPTVAGPPSLDVKLWKEDGSHHFKSAAGTMKFVYGYVTTKTGEVRVGWMALPGLVPSSGCQ